MQGDDTDGICDNCGAAKTPGLACCKFCNRPFVADLQARSVPCWKCKAYNDWGVLKCTKCNEHVVVQCLFCQSLSPHHVPACLRCKETFQGMRERFAAKQSEQTMQQVASVGTAVVSVLGAAALSGGTRTRRRHRHRAGDADATAALVKGLGKLLDDD
jgi:hypothetical protein